MMSSPRTKTKTRRFILHCYTLSSPERPPAHTYSSLGSDACSIIPCDDASMLPETKRRVDYDCTSIDLLRRSQIEITGPASVTINAEANTVATIPAFADVFAERRCIIPTSGFFYSVMNVGPSLLEQTEALPP
jgi:hypothetical protein